MRLFNGVKIGKRKLIKIENITLDVMIKYYNNNFKYHNNINIYCSELDRIYSYNEDEILYGISYLKLFNRDQKLKELGI